MTDFDKELSDLKNRYPGHFDEWLRREKAEAVADFTHAYLDPRHVAIARLYIRENLT